VPGATAPHGAEESKVRQRTPSRQPSRRLAAPGAPPEERAPNAARLCGAPLSTPRACPRDT
jgi:hypothetical protein